MKVVKRRQYYVDFELAKDSKKVGDSREVHT